MYIYQLPLSIIEEVAHTLDEQDTYKDLAIKHMMFDIKILNEIESLKSPARGLLMKWANYNHTVEELFCLLLRIEEYEALQTLGPYISDGQLREVLNRLPPNTGNLDNNHQQLLLPITPANNNNINSVDSCEDNEAIVSYDGNVPNSINSAAIAQSAGTIPEIHYDELKAATSEWSIDCVLGSGGFATVYKGNWKCTPVAIKRIGVDHEDVRALKQLVSEVRALNSCRHDNILPLYGFSTDGPEPCLVYQYMSGGSLQSRLRNRPNKPVLSWPTRLNIIHGVARGLQFLHTVRSTPLIHGDIKPANILLDANDFPRIGDFGLSQEGPVSGAYEIIAKVFGTLAYLPLEALKKKRFSTKIDVFSFGVVILETLTGMNAYSTRFPHKFLCAYVSAYHGDLLDLKDATPQDDSTNSTEVYLMLMSLAKWCTSVHPQKRPEMIDVLKALDDRRLYGVVDESNEEPIGQ